MKRLSSLKGVMALGALSGVLVGTVHAGPAATGEGNAPFSTKRGFVMTDLGHVHYVEAGSSDGPPVVLMHQTPLSVNEFAGVVPLLAAKHRVIAIDMPGYGCSDRPAKQPQIRDYAEAVLAVLDGLQIDKAHLVGHHTGTVLAVELAAQHPGRVASLVLSGPHYLDAEARRELVDVSVQWHVKPDGSHLQEKWNKLDAWISDPRVLHQVVIDIMRAGETSEYGHFAATEYRMEERLPLVKGPALIVISKNDPFTPEETSRMFTRTIKPSREVVLDGGVFLPSEWPEAFAKIVLEYLEER